MFRLMQQHEDQLFLSAPLDKLGGQRDVAAVGVCSPALGVGLEVAKQEQRHVVHEVLMAVDLRDGALDALCRGVLGVDVEDLHCRVLVGYVYKFLSHKPVSVAHPCAVRC